MYTNNHINELRTKLLLIFFINFFLLLATSLFLLCNIGLNGKSETADDFIVERFGIIVSLLVIPLSLKFYHRAYQNIKEKKDENNFLVKFRNIYLLRLIGIDFAIVFNLIGYYYIGAVNFMYLVLVCLLVFFLCLPSRGEMDIVQNKNEEENIEKKKID